MNKTLKIVIASLMLIAVALLVPSALILSSWTKDTIHPLMTFGPFTLTPYSLCMAVGALIALAAAMIAGRDDPGAEHALSAGLSALAGAVLGGHLIYCLTMGGKLAADYEQGELLWVLFNRGGYTFYGAVIGGVAGAAVYAAAAKQRFLRLADVLAPGAALAVCIGRAAEYFSGQGYGQLLEEESPFAFFPAAICTYDDGWWTEWSVNIWILEAIAALAAFAAAILVLKRSKRNGETAAWTFCVIGAAQIMLESLRSDEFIRFGFVRFNQLAAAVSLLVILVPRLVRCVRLKGWTGWAVCRIILFVLGIGLVIGVEFALDKTAIDNGLLRAVMAIAIGMMTAAVLRDGVKA